MRLPTFNSRESSPVARNLPTTLPYHVVVWRGHRAIEIAPHQAMVRDERSVGRPIEVEFSGRLRPLQQDAVDAFAQHDEGILCAPTAFGRRQSQHG